MKRHLLTSAFALALTAFGSPANAKNIVMIAGKPSHGPAQHEHNAGIQLLAKCLQQNTKDLDIKVHLNAEWPSAEELGKADTIVMYADGGGNHPALQGDHLAELGKEMKRGCGFVCLHYAVEVPITPGGPEFTDWLGGYFEPNWSVNPHWEADFKELPKHAISSGVKPFATNDEWYFHMRFRKDMKGVTPILTAIAPDSTMSRKDGAHEGNPTVREEVKNKVPQHTAWAVEREDGGRGFGFSGGHFHMGWGNNDQRKLVLNAILWSAHAEVPAAGVESAVTEDDLKANLDPKPGQGLPEKPKAAPKPVAAPEKKAASTAAPTAKPVASTGLVHKGTVTVKADLKGAKELFLIATDGGDGSTGDWANWAEPVLLKADGSKIKLTEVAPRESKVGFGQLGINKNAGGKEMKIDGKPVPFGFGAHAPSMIAFNLPADVVGFESKVGIDNGGTDQSSGATVVFQVFTQKPSEAALANANTSSGKPYGFEAANDLMSNFKTPDGLEAKLLASEPMIQNPTNIDVDASGRVWVAECVNYRKYASPMLRPEGDRITVNEDTDGDGVLDKQTVFFQSPELTNPLGICVLPQRVGTKVIVSAAPWVWLLTDADGDGKAEKAEKLFFVEGGAQHDHHIHAFSFGVDGKFYFNMGNAGTALKNPDGSPVIDLAGNKVSAEGRPYRQGMIFRCDIDLEKGVASNVETLAYNFRNNYEVAVDSLGGMWQSDNDDDGNKGVRINNIVDYGSYGYSDEMTGAGWHSPRTKIETEIPLMHWHQNDPGTIPNLLQTGSGSPTGIYVNEGSLLGKQFENQVIHCDAGPRTVRAYPVKKAGAGYTAEMVDILTTDDTWYRPSDCGIAPDGSLIIADWYDPGVGGHAMGDNDPEKIRGRIYRVAPKGKAYKITPPDLSTAEGCVTALKSPNKATQYMAWTRLNGMLQDPPMVKKVTTDKDGNKTTTFKVRDEAGAVTDAERELNKLYKSGKTRERARALALLVHVPDKARSYLDTALTDEESDIRAAAWRELRVATALVAHQILDGQKIADSGDYPNFCKTDRETASDLILSRAAKETKKLVLREMAVTLHAARNAERETSTLRVAKKATEPTEAKPGEVAKAVPLNETVELVSVPFIDTAAQAWTALAQKHDGKDRWYLEALGVAAAGREDACFAQWMKAVGSEWNTPAGRDIIWRSRSLGTLDYLVKLLTSKKEGVASLRYLRSFDFLPDGETKNQALLKIVNTGTAKTEILSDALNRLGKTELRSHPDVKKAMESMLAATEGKPAFIDVVRNFHIPGQSAQLLKAALADVKDPRALLAVQLIIEDSAGRELLEKELGAEGSDKLVGLLGGSGEHKAVQLLVLTATNSERSETVRKSAVKALGLSAAGAEAMIKLASEGKFPEDLKADAAQALSTVAYPGISERAAKAFPAAAGAEARKLPPIAELAKLKGDIKRGKALFESPASSCVACHRIGDTGVDFAPGLSEIGSKLGKEAIYDAIINPNAGISMGFETWLLKLKNGQISMGIIRGETNDQVTVAMPGGVTNQYAKNQIAERTKLPTSMMPLGFDQRFSQAELTDLVEYLFSLKTAAAKKK
jgi:putative membrane-bound dehydrogenase-like protein